MMMNYFLLFMTVLPMVALVIFFTVKVFYIDEHIREWIKDRNRVAQLRWESKQVQGILNNMSEEGVLQKMTSIERIELHEILAKEYPVWYSIHGYKMAYIPKTLR